MSIVFGTYRLNDDSLNVAVKRAWAAGIRHFDTAKLYRNEVSLGIALRECMGPNDKVQITTKIWETGLHAVETIANNLKNSITSIKKAIGVNPDQVTIRVLLHHPGPSYMWWILEEFFKQKVVDSIGVSNHDILALTKLLERAVVKPFVNQIEVHPWLPREELDELLEFCGEKGILIEAHSVLGKALYLDEPKLSIIPNQTSAQVLVKFAARRSNAVCISTVSERHLRELCEALSDASKDDTSKDDTSKDTITLERKQRFYPFKKVESEEFPDFHSVDDVLHQIRMDMEILQIGDTERVSNLLFILPTVKARFSSIGQTLALAMFPADDISDHPSKIAKFHALTQPLRRFCSERYTDHLKQTLLEQKGFQGGTCCILKRNPVTTDADKISEQILDPRPMPVDVAPKEHLQPFFQFLQNDIEWNGDREFFRGASFKDGRMDLCKQVVGPTHIDALCEAVQHNSHIRHFLLGNNIAFDGAPPQLAHSMAQIMSSNSPPIETWCVSVRKRLFLTFFSFRYLAGNCINDAIVKELCQGLMTNTVAKSLWLKRNPLGPKGMWPMRNLLECNNTLTTLDLDNCGILDEGIEILAEAKNCSIRHLYMDANGITETGAMHLAKFVEAHVSVLKSLYVSINRFGDTGAIAICEALRDSKTLKRLSMSSNRITDAAAEQIVDCILSCSNLIICDVGCYKSTFDMGEKANSLTNVLPWIRLVAAHPKIKILDLLMNQMKIDDIETLLAVGRLRGEINIYAATLGGPRDRLFYESIKDKKIVKFIKHPKCIINIDSMYRNKM